MATTLSYAKIVRNQKDDEKSAHMDKNDTSLENSNTTQIDNNTDLSKEASNRKKVNYNRLDICIHLDKNKIGKSVLK